eukprot:Clim_evm11s251 gene=Clim_evmTU11s251
MPPRKAKPYASSHQSHAKFPIYTTTQVFYDLSASSALPSWALLMLLPNWEYTNLLATCSILISCFGYLFLLVKNSAEANGGFDSLERVIRMFHHSSPNVLAAAWIHYLGFDLFVGMWINKQCLELDTHLVFRVLFLFSTLMLGPSGLLFFVVYRAMVTESLPGAFF